MNKIMVGARAVVYINGQRYGLVTHFKFDSQTQQRPVYGLDSGDPYEFIPQTNRIAGNFNILRAIKSGGLEGAGITHHFQDVPRGKYVSIMVIDRGTDTVIFRADRAVILNQSWDIPSRGIMTGAVSFEAFDWSNEATQKP